MKCILLCYSLFLFSCTTVSNKQAEPKLPTDGLHTILQTGLPEVESIIQKNVLAEKYGVKYRNLGCVFEKSTLDSIKKINDSVSKIVAMNFGQNWRLKLRSQLDSMDDVRDIAYAYMLNRKVNQDEYLYFLAFAGKQKNEFLVKAYSVDFERDKYYTHYYIGVNYKTKSVFGFIRAGHSVSKIEGL